MNGGAIKGVRRRPATATDVARLAGVSQSAVSRAFTPGASVAEETRARIAEAAASLGYRPNAIARSLVSRRSRVIGVVAAYLQNHFYPDVLERLSAALRQEGYHILLFTTDAASAADPLLEEIIAYRVDALILASTSLSSALADECRAAGIPVLLFNRTTAAGDVASVTGENRRGGQVIAEFCVACGHRRPAFVAGIENSSTSRDRERGFVERLAELGAPVPMRAVGEYRFDRAAEAARDLLSRPERPDFIFCGNDHMAMAISDVVRHEFRLRVPEDVALVGFDNVAPADWPSFDLTTFSQPAGPMVDRAVAMVLELIEEPRTPIRHETVRGELFLRRSTPHPAGAETRDGHTIWRPPGERLAATRARTPKDSER
jgi:DNA-binding LacI/PurR family transcriptional regulator